ncbi:uncharacterized protein LOC108625386 [Ceratina calcarata]|uniref:Uncharacterized protein LOC108625386 n=1 Tax=Ceratina calcarata TaxID=156304 RepID=A0AAJ7IZ83_9HYME|nr:uncharacterized protein LOC108625386 [Ceratina calcarata]
MDEYKAWIKALELDIECPICLDIPQTSALLCINGHHVCQSCHKAKKLEICPTCFQDFTEAKNLFLDKFIGSLEILQESIEKIVEKERQNVHKICHEYMEQHKKEILQKAVRSVCTQTDFKETPTYRQNNQPSNNKKLKILYPCNIGKCERRYDYTSLIIHVKREHNNIFSETAINAGETFFKKFELPKEELPKIYDFAFHISNMGLFFFNITIHTSGELKAVVILVNQSIPKIFSCEFGVSCRNVLLKNQGIVKSCDPNIRMISNHEFHLNKDKMFHVKRNKTLDCTLKITEIRRNPPSNNPIPSLF